MQRLQVTEDEPAGGRKRSVARNAPKFDLRARLFSMGGVHHTAVPGVDVTAALVVVWETGAALTAFPTGKHFASWLGLAPSTKISGGKKPSGRTLPSSNRAAQALRLAAAALRTSQSALWAHDRRLCARMDKPKAVTSAAHKLARLIYAMLSPDTRRPVGVLCLAKSRAAGSAPPARRPEASSTRIKGRRTTKSATETAWWPT